MDAKNKSQSKNISKFVGITYLTLAGTSRSEIGESSQSHLSEQSLASPVRLVHKSPNPENTESKHVSSSL